jgi:hypothetical protein
VRHREPARSHRREFQAAFIACLAAASCGARTQTVATAQTAATTENVAEPAARPGLPGVDQPLVRETVAARTVGEVSHANATFPTDVVAVAPEPPEASEAGQWNFTLIVASTVGGASPGQSDDQTPVNDDVTVPEGSSEVANGASAPLDPASVRLVLSDAVVTLEWSVSSGAVNGYRVRRNGSTIAELPLRARTYVDRPVVGSTVTYQVVAFGPGGESPGASTNVVTIPSGANSMVNVEQTSSNSGDGVSSQQNTVIIIPGGKP